MHFQNLLFLLFICTFLWTRNKFLLLLGSWWRYSLLLWSNRDISLPWLCVPRLDQVFLREDHRSECPLVQQSLLPIPDICSHQLNPKKCYSYHSSLSHTLTNFVLVACKYQPTSIFIIPVIHLKPELYWLVQFECHFLQKSEWNWYCRSCLHLH